MSLRRTATLAFLTATLAAGTTVAPTATAGAEPGRSHAERSARAALERVQDTLRGDDGRELSAAYRDLFTTKTALRGGARASADNLLARPTDPQEFPGDPRDIYYGEGVVPQTSCEANLCLHWVEEGEHAATPEFAAEVLATLRQVSQQYADAGLKLPLPDQGEEGTTQTDFYLGELLTAGGALGFCRTDADEPTVGSAYAVFCGFDNDFAEYGPDYGPMLMRATVAHEYFHAVQYAYDGLDDGWIYESTAAWVEDEVYDDVDDSAFFLNFGQAGDPDGPFAYPFAGPSFPLDVLDDFGGFNTYGNWGFWRYLTEQHPASTAGIPDLVREFFERLDTTAGPNPTSSREALEGVLAARGSSLADEYAGYAAANQAPTAFYEEGHLYPTAPDGFAPVALTRTAPTAVRALTLDHLTSASGTVTPFPGSRQLKIRLDGGDGVRVVAVVHEAEGGVRTVVVPVGPQGRGSVTVPFDGGVDLVEVTVAHGGTTDGQDARVRFQAVG